MKRNAGLAATALLAASLCAAQPALAGDKALANFIGFSDDGLFFAFEEYGYEDASGYPYSNIYVVDLLLDKWVGEPFRVIQSYEEATLEQTRDEARLQARPLLDELVIERPVGIIAMQADGEFSSGLSLDFGMPSPEPGYWWGDYRLNLEMFDASSSECLASLGQTAKGFELTVDAKGQLTVLHRDGEVLPRSRNCALSYRIYAVVAPAYGGSRKGAVIVSVYSYGWEDPERHFVAVPIDIEF